MEDGRRFWFEGVELGRAKAGGRRGGCREDNRGVMIAELRGEEEDGVIPSMVMGRGWVDRNNWGAGAWLGSSGSDI
jgi:hypothetical protein